MERYSFLLILQIRYTIRILKCKNTILTMIVVP